MPYLFPKWLHHFTFSPTMCESYKCFFTLPGYDVGSYFNFSPSDEYVVNGISLWSWFVFCNDVKQVLCMFPWFSPWWRFFFSTKLSKPSKSCWIMTPIALISIHWFGRHHKLDLPLLFLLFKFIILSLTGSIFISYRFQIAFVWVITRYFKYLWIL